MRRLLVASIAVGVALCVSSCSIGSMPVPSSDSSGSGSASPSSGPHGRNVPKLIPTAKPKANLPYFLYILNAAYESNSGPDTTSEAMASAVASAGFDAGTIQISDNSTALGLNPDAKYVSVIFNGECLVGTWGSSVTSPTAVVLPLLPQGGCLLGGTIHSYR